MGLVYVALFSFEEMKQDCFVEYITVEFEQWEYMLFFDSFDTFQSVAAKK